MLGAALAAWDAGLCPVRVRVDGSKRPVGAWARWQVERPSRDQVAEWWADGWPGLGIVCGRVSGGLLMVELEARAVEAGLADEVDRAMVAAGLGEVWERVVAGCTERSPSGGLHVLVRVDGGVCPGSERLAVDADGRVLVETRGEGGMVVVAPSHGPVHPSGRPWEMVYGGFGSIVTVDEGTLDGMFAVLRGFDQRAAPDPGVGGGRGVGDGGVVWERVVDWVPRVVEAFNRSTSWAELISSWGEIVGEDAEDLLVHRHGSVNQVAARISKESDRIRVFSSNPPRGISAFDGRRIPSYDRFSWACALECGSADDLRVRVGFARRLAARFGIDPDADDPFGASPGADAKVAGGTVADATTGWPCLPDGFWSARPELDHVRRAALSRLISPDALLGVVLARVVALTHHRVSLPPIVGRRSDPALIVGVVAPPGAGKGSAMDAARDLVPDGGEWTAGPLVEAPAGSGEGLVKLFFGEVTEERDGRTVRVQRQTRWNALIRVDEIEALQRLAARRDQTVMATLRQAWSGEMIGGAYSDAEKDRRLRPGSYRLCAVLGVQPALAQWVVDDDPAGTPQRIVWVPGVHPLPGVEDGMVAWPGQLDWVAPRPSRMDEPCDMLVASEICAGLRAAHVAHVRGETVGQAHAGLRRLKLAAAFALLDQRLDVRVDDWELAGMVDDVSTAVLARVQTVLGEIRRLAAQSDAERARRRRRAELEAEAERETGLVERAAQIVARRAARAGVLTVRDVTQCLPSHYRRWRDAALELAVERGWLVAVDGGWAADPVNGG